MRKIFPILFSFTLSFLTLVACAGKQSSESKVAEIEASDSLPQSVKILVRAVADGDSSAFASIVSYPLERPYPLRDIKDSVEMVKYYNVIVDDSLHHVLTTSSPDKWNEYGWRGWTVNNGEYLWIDENLYDIGYLSKEEIKERDRLIAEEIASLPTGMREGWTPVVCLKATDGKSFYRIDSHPGPGEGDMYRLSIYDLSTPLNGSPALILTGYSETEGTANTTTYHFSDEQGEEALYEADITDSSTPKLVFTLKGKSTEVEVEKAYWRDILNKR